MRFSAALAVVVLSLLGACDDPKSVLAQTINANKACDNSSQCVVAGATDCSCAEAINSAGVPEVEEVAASVDCCVLGQCSTVDCAAPVNLRCELNLCVTD